MAAKSCTKQHMVHSRLRPNCNHTQLVAHKQGPKRAAVSLSSVPPLHPHSPSRDLYCGKQAAASNGTCLLTPHIFPARRAVPTALRDPTRGRQAAACKMTNARGSGSPSSSSSPVPFQLGTGGVGSCAAVRDSWWYLRTAGRNTAVRG